MSLTNKTIIVNIYKEDCDIYIGRGQHPQTIGINLGNPWSHVKPSRGIFVPTREIAIANHKSWLNYSDGFKNFMPKQRTQILDNLHLLANKRLGCHCKK